MRNKLWPSVLFIMALFALSACSPNVVALYYEPSPELGPKCSQSVTVLPFEDATGKRSIGLNRKGEQIFSDTAVEKWVRLALTRQLEAQGCLVRFLDSASKGLTVTGQVLDVDLQEVSSSEFQASLRVKVLLRNVELQNQALYQETFGVKISKHILPGSTRVEDLLQELMHQLMQAMVPKLVQRMQEA